jgi:type I restriction enzyme, S subunit
VEVKCGYKQPESSVVPDDWRDVLLDSIAKRGSGHTPDKKHPEYWNGSIKWISLADSAALDRGFIDDTTFSITPEGIAHSSAVLHPAGTVVLSRDAGVGKSAIMRTEMAVSQHFMAWQCGSLLDNLFLYYWLQAAKPTFERIANGTTIKTIGLQYFRDLTVPHPPLHEQHAIATALSDVDALLGGLECLIAKKRDLKQAAMQQLLTGQTRLPGFHDDWETIRFADLADKSRQWSIVGGPFGSNLKASDYTEDGVRIIQLQNIGDGRFLDDYAIYTSESKADELLSNNIYPGELILSKMGDPVARACLIPSTNRRYLMASDGIRVVADPLQFDTRFVLEYINSPYFRQKAMESSTGSTRQRIGMGDLKRLPFIKPRLPEQAAIATVLSDMDAELAVLAARRDKTHALKQAMMQELLTGKTRLVSAGGTHA